MMPVGIPCSQFLGEFHGRSDILSWSVLAQPARNKKPALNRSRKPFERLKRMGLVKNLVAFHDLVALPFRNDVRNALIRTHLGDANFGD